MNLLLLTPDQFLTTDTAMASIRQSDHIIKILKLKTGDKIALGVLNGKTGTGLIGSISNNYCTIDTILLTQEPTAILPITLILAMPRPQMLKRILQTIACMGVETLHLLQTAKVEKSFWQSPSATPEAIHKELLLGLEQGVATQMPNVHYHKRFTPFAEDVLPSLTAKHKIIAHPGGKFTTPKLSEKDDSILVIGPESGLLEKEVQTFEALGYRRTMLGKRILKVETAVPTLIGKLYL